MSNIGRNPTTVERKRKTADYAKWYPYKAVAKVALSFGVPYTVAYLARIQNWVNI